MLNLAQFSHSAYSLNTKTNKKQLFKHFTCSLMMTI